MTFSMQPGAAPELLAAMRAQQQQPSAAAAGNDNALRLASKPSPPGGISFVAAYDQPIGSLQSVTSADRKRADAPALPQGSVSATSVAGSRGSSSSLARTPYGLASSLYFHPSQDDDASAAAAPASAATAAAGASTSAAATTAAKDAGGKAPTAAATTAGASAGPATTDGGAYNEFSKPIPMDPAASVRDALSC
jgi:hypothetical protein